jgi:predicted ATPase
MGEVYLAHDTRLGRPVALKILPANVAADRERMQRFVQEAQAASALNHPNILTVYEIQQADSVHFIATEFVDGETLERRIKRGCPTVAEALEFTIQIASALAAAHARGIVHRDVKPANIMLRGDGLVKLLDFGLAKLGKAEGIADTAAPTKADFETSPGTMLGTLPYMSPEQARGLEVDARTDIWSLGCVLYETITARRPFSGHTPSDVLAAILNTSPLPLAHYTREAPQRLQDIICKVLEKRREDRYQTAGDLLVDLRRLKKRMELAQLVRISSGSQVPGDASATLPHAGFLMQPSEIVGRDREIDEVCRELRSESTRLVTLTGIGGTGKTTLARVVAGQLINDFTDGMCFVDLAAVRHHELVPATIAQALGVKEGDSKPVVGALKDHLRHRRVLIVLDNFEQVLPAAGILAELLASAPALKILVTSRALLQLSYEREYIVPPLAAPRSFGEGSPEDLMKFDAVKLFVERARSVNPAFALTHDNARSVAGICARLDGLPLGIELAAARMKMLSPQAILSRLVHRLKLLTGGSRDLPTRQQTMRGTMDWSYELLTEAEQRIFRRLAVFAGGFTLEFAEKVVDDDEGTDVLDIVTSLVNKSLLLAEQQARGEVRFRLLGVVREYAHDRLDESGEVPAIRRKHAAYLLALVEEAEPNLRSAQPAESLNRLEEEYDNIREALRWSLANDADTAARIAVAIRYFWDFLGYLTEGLGILKEIFALGDRVPPKIRCLLLSMAGNIAKFQGDYATAHMMYERGLQESRELGDLSQVALLCRGLGGLAVENGDPEGARRFIEEAFAAARAANDNFGVARSLNMLGDLARSEGDYRSARPLLAEALELCRQTGNKYATANILNNLAAADYGDGDYAASLAHFTEGLKMAQERGYKVTGDRIAISYSLDGFAALAVPDGRGELGAKLAGAAEHMREAMNFHTEPAERRFRETYLAALKALLPEPGFSAAYEQGSRLRLEECMMLALTLAADEK